MCPPAPGHPARTGSGGGGGGCSVHCGLRWQATPPALSGPHQPPATAASPGNSSTPESLHVPYSAKPSYEKVPAARAVPPRCGRGSAHDLCPFRARLPAFHTILRPSENQTGFRARRGPSVKVFHWNKDYNAVTQSVTLQWDLIIKSSRISSFETHCSFLFPVVYGLAGTQHVDQANASFRGGGGDLFLPGVGSGVPAFILRGPCPHTL